MYEVAAEFERLFGCTQADIRALFMKEGTRALQRYARRMRRGQAGWMRRTHFLSRSL